MANIATFLFQHDETPNRVLYRQFIDTEWVDFKAREILDLARSWQAFFRSMGLQQGDRVAICLKNSVRGWPLTRPPLPWGWSQCHFT